MFSQVFEEADRRWTVLQMQLVFIAAALASYCSEIGGVLVKSALELIWPVVMPLGERFEHYCESLFAAAEPMPL